jgi:hypothetical protein
MRIYDRIVEEKRIGYDGEAIHKEWLLETDADPNFDSVMRGKFMHIRVQNSCYWKTTPHLSIKGSGTNWFTKEEKNPLKKKVFDLVADFLKDELLPETLVTTIK